MGKETGRIRRLSEFDLPGLMIVEELSFSTPWSKQSLLAEVKNPIAYYWVWEMEGKIAGYLGVWFILDEAQITNVAVHPEYRGMGGAKLLITQLLESMKEKGIKSATLEVRPTNEKAIKLYEKFGFTEIGRRVGYYIEEKEDALIFEVKVE